MSDFILSCCSTSDLTLEHYKKRNIEIAYFHFKIGENEYKDDFGQSISYDEFYNRMEQGEITKTSQINVSEFLDYFRSLLATGKDILHVTLSSGLTGVINSANSAKKILEEEFPNQKIYLVDSLCASSGFGMLIDYLADLKEEGKTIEEVYKYALDTRLNIHHWFFSTDLKYYVRGGRISKTSGTIGTILHICPLLHVDARGLLIPKQKVISKKRVIKELVKKMEEYAIDGLNYSGKCYISHSRSIDDALKIKRLVEEKFVNLKDKVEIFNIGTTIGSHSGPGTAALFFMGKKREID